MSHDHKWDCSDVPGIFTCSCGSERYFNRLTQTYYVTDITSPEPALGL